MRDAEELRREICLEEGKIAQLEETITELIARKKVIKHHLRSLRADLNGCTPRATGPDERKSMDQIWAETSGIHQLGEQWTNNETRAKLLGYVYTESDAQISLQTNDYLTAMRRIAALEQILATRNIKGGRLVVVVPPNKDPCTAYYHRTTY